MQMRGVACEQMTAKPNLQSDLLSSELFDLAQLVLVRSFIRDGRFPLIFEVVELRVTKKKQTGIERLQACTR